MDKKVFSLFYILVFSLLFINDAFSQDRLKLIENQLAKIDSTAPGLGESVTFSMSNMPIQELIRNLAQLTKLNITIDPAINNVVTHNFSEVIAKDLIVFLCKQYNLALQITGSIIAITKYDPPKEIVAYISKKPNVFYDSGNLSLDLKNDSLYLVAREITKHTGINILLSPSVSDKKVNVFIEKTSFDLALEKMALANDLEITNDRGIYLISLREIDKKNTKGKQAKFVADEPDSYLDYSISDSGTITLNAYNISINQLIIAISDKLNVNYFIYSKLDDLRTIQIKDVKYDDFLTYIFDGSKFTYKNVNSIYIVGERNLENLRTFKVLQLKSRSVIDIVTVIPSKLKEGIEVKEFPDLNSLVISGSTKNINELEAFVFEIDKIVPMILIEVLIVDSRSNVTIATGISTGLGTSPTTTKGSILPGIDWSFNAESLNNLINSFNGFGWFNLGKVTPNFYLSLKALETNGLVKVRSTPRLSTLNGYEATITIGNTEYYLEETNSIIGTQNPQNIVTKNYKPVKVDFTLRIKPIVSGNEQITLNIFVEQSDFTSRISKEAPPGSISRNFTSQVRIRNEEMILLGGLEEKKVTDSGAGLPILNRIPIIKWLFSSRLKENSFEKLNVFIKPTIIY